MYYIIILFLCLCMNSFLISFYAQKESISELSSEQPHPFEIIASTLMGSLFEIMGVSGLCVNRESSSSQINKSFR